MPAKKDKKPLKDDIIRDVYWGVITPVSLSKELYHETANVLKKGAYKGYGGTLVEFGFDTPDFATLQELRTNIYMFSAAKTFQQTLEMTQAMTEGDRIIPFDEFKEKAAEIYTRYNGEELDADGDELNGWLKAEYDTAVGMSRSAAKWTKVEGNKERFPYLKYIAVMDSHTCDICAPLDGITLPLDDPFWDSNMPLNHFNCECTVEQLDAQDADEEGISEDYEVERATRASHETKNPLFNMNPGKSKVVFKDTGRNKHPYFDVSRAYKELAENNFNLEIPEED